MPVQAQDGSLSSAVVRRQVEKILHSGEFAGSELLRNLLSFLTEHSIEKPGEPIKEYELAVAVLGKAEGFDPRLDSAVRVHAARLRSKLAEYYMSDGGRDPVLIEVPKGSYHVAWRTRSLESTPSAQPPQDAILPAPPLVSIRKWFAAGFLTAAILCAVAVGTWMSIRAPKLPAVVEAFWEPFLKPSEAPVIVFSNHRFVGTSSTSLRHFREGFDSPSDANDTYSGTGTVMAVAELNSLFSLVGHASRSKRAELLTWDEAKDANLVFVGAPDANSRLRELAPMRHFQFKSGYEEPRYGTGGIVNVDPAPGEEAVYFGPGMPYASDYAIVAMLPNLNPARKVLILAGTNTYGCQAAAEFVTRADSLTEIYKRLGVPKGGKLPDFEALLKVTVGRGVPIRTDVMIVREHQPHGPVR